MKKFYVLLTVMVLALMTAGFSYAYWTDMLTVNGTANTGSLEVEFVELDLTDNEFGYGVLTKSAITDAKHIEFHASNLYPGAVVTYTGQVENTGTIPAKLVSLVPTGNATFVVLDDSAFVGDLAVGATWDFTITITVPTTWTGDENELTDFDFGYTLNFTQFNN